jgi:threonine dehydrogenase-like Zn-dependent dehydrogenase
MEEGSVVSSIDRYNPTHVERPAGLMRALWLEDKTLRVRDDVPEPEPTAGEAVIAVRRAGVCNTDLELQRGYYPYTGIPGHEFVGVVVEAPPGSPWKGRRVVGEINASCGDCATCRTGRRTHCERRTVLGIVNRNGAFAERLVLPVENLHEVPDTVSDDEAVFVEPLAAAHEIGTQVTIDPDEPTLVIGDGKLGNLIAQTLRLSWADLRVVSRNPGKRAILEAMGLRTMTAAEIVPGRAALVVECTGNPEGLVLARKAVRPRGTIVLKSTYAGDTTLNLSSIVVDEITLVGSRCGPFAPALYALAQKKVDVKPLVHARYALQDAVDAFAHAARPGVLKVLVEP